MAPSLRRSVLAIAALIVLAAGCGGKLAVQDFDRAPPSGKADASAADTGGPVSDCPSSHVLVEIGSTCAWTGTCTVPLDVCGDGVGLTVATPCKGGLVVGPQGPTTGCPTPPTDDASSPQACPGDVIVGAACAFAGACEVAYCGPTEPLLTCTCTAGVWQCPGVASCVASNQCAEGAGCAAGLTTCIVPGSGPCGSDARLVCNIGLRYATDGFLCDGVATGCAVHMAGLDGGPACNESCQCENGLMVCSGDCATGG